MGTIKDLTRQKFNRLIVVRFVEIRHRCAIWLCRCDCDGKEIEVQGGNLVNGHTKSCGCAQREVMAARMKGRYGIGHPTFKHGRVLGRTYTSWQHMIQRCTNSKHKHWTYYGGANPSVLACARWLGEHGFENFLADMGERPEGTSLGRFGDVGNYEKSNCSWQTVAQQNLEAKIKKWNRQLQAIHAFHGQKKAA
jgi:hypothetical protein